MSRDEERIEEEIAGAERPARPRNMSAAYLQQALDALHAAGNAASLYTFDLPPATDQRSATMRVLARTQARSARRMICRSVVLFAAFAAESYVNEFLAALMTDRRDRLREIDRWRTIDKYLVGTLEAYGERLFFDGREPMPVLRELFTLRNKLAHPRPGFGPAGGFDADDEAEADFAPPRIAEFVVTVGGCGHILVGRAYGFDHPDVTASAIWLGRDPIRAYALRAATMPPPGRAPERPLLHQAITHVGELRQTADQPDLSINRLLTARQAHDRKEPESS
jgi:hypothetical protein